MGLVDDAIGGNRRALARLATHIENADDLAAAVAPVLYAQGGNARTIGITGPPGAGKSTLVGRLAAAIRASDRTVAIVAIDPSSPITGGATLGDRIRMLDVQSDPGVFIRSAASRGRTGGLAHTTAELIHLFDAVGFDVVIVETVGIGQEEIDIVHHVETVVLVQVPGLGDTVQSLKAGVLEIADIYIVNKCDLPGAELSARELRALLGLSPVRNGWAPPVISVSSKEILAIDEALNAIIRHGTWQKESGAIFERRSAIARAEIAQQIKVRVDRRLDERRRSEDIETLIHLVVGRQMPPAEAAKVVLDRWSSDGRI